MVFSSITFLFAFLPVCLLGYFLLPEKLRNAWLLLLSLVFYWWGEQLYVAVMLATIVFNYWIGLRIDRYGPSVSDWVARRRRTLALGVTGNLGLLFGFKYANFAVDNLNAALSLVHVSPLKLPSIHLPIGISFFTFQAISYIVDIYRREVPASRSLVDYAMYKAFFPQLIAGPIVRYRDVAAAVKKRQITTADFAEGIERFILGLAKKALVANVVAQPADYLFELEPSQLTSGLAWYGVLCYALQIYFDFSGYSDMAIGMGRMFGFRFLENFNLPYAASSIRDFWRRWHISLSTWFRDYLYIPLGGNRRGEGRAALNLFGVFVLCGFWHGAAWTFLIWGVYHGVFLTLEHWGLEAALQRLPRPFRIAYVWVVVLVGWVFFRASSLPHALAYLKAMAGWQLATANADAWFDTWNRETALSMCFAVPLSLGLRQLLAKHAGRLFSVGASSEAGAVGAGTASQLLLGALFYLSVLALAGSTYNPFIYFRF